MLQAVINLTIDPTTFGDIVYVPGVSGFPVDASFYYDERIASQLLELIHSDIFRPMTTFSHVGATYFFTFFDAFSIHRYTRFVPLFFIGYQHISMDIFLPHHDGDPFWLYYT